MAPMCVALRTGIGVKTYLSHEGININLRVLGNWVLRRKFELKN
jgi:hypothetical protein